MNIMNLFIFFKTPRTATDNKRQKTPTDNKRQKTPTDHTCNLGLVVSDSLKKTAHLETDSDSLKKTAHLETDSNLGEKKGEEP